MGNPSEFFGKVLLLPDWCSYYHPSHYRCIARYHAGMVADIVIMKVTADLVVELTLRISTQ